MKDYSLFASCPRFYEDLLEKEILALGGRAARRTPGGVSFEGSREFIYRFCLNSRIGSHLFLLLYEGAEKVLAEEILTPWNLYEEARSFSWDRVMEGNNTFSCRAVLKGHFPFDARLAALKLKDAIADFWRDKQGERPFVDRDNPDLLFHLYADKKGKMLIYLDLSGGSLSFRGYRKDSASAGLRENTAAGMLWRSGWKEKSSAGWGFLDPLCGSATLLIEGAMMAADLPCNLRRSTYGFFHWKDHDPDLWEELVDEAEIRWKEGVKNIPYIAGFDQDRSAVGAANENLKRAGLEKYIHVERQGLSDFKATEAMGRVSAFLILTNPPYGHRLGQAAFLHSLYREIGIFASQSVFEGGQLSVISSEKALLKSIALVRSRENRIMNGSMECVLRHYKLFKKDGHFEGPSEHQKRRASSFQETALLEELTPQAIEFLNRLKKRKKQLAKWLKREGISSYRLYDADLHNFNVAVDVYENKWALIQEYKAPSSVEQEQAKKHFDEALKGVQILLNLPPYRIFAKRRGTSRYTAATGERYLVREGDLKFWLNFTDYLDTGLFLDHRNIRRWLRENSSGKRVLNLFAYTCSASAAAALGGAAVVVSVDSSRTYLHWGQDNFQLNGLKPENYIFDRSDCFSWLRKNREKFDIIFLDPPTFSNSKSSRSTFDVQKDHAPLVRLCMRHLNPAGLLIFSNNFTRFELDETLCRDFEVREESSWTVSKDFHRKKSGHRCWFIRGKRTVLKGNP